MGDRLPGWNGDYSRRWVAATLHRWGTVCHLCRQDGATTADHVIPRSKGGPDTLANLRPAHGPCNYARGDMDLIEWFRRHPLPQRTPLARSTRWAR